MQLFKQANIKAQKFEPSLTLVSELDHHQPRPHSADHVKPLPFVQMYMRFLPPASAPPWKQVIVRKVLHHRSPDWGKENQDRDKHGSCSGAGKVRAAQNTRAGCSVFGEPSAIHTYHDPTHEECL